MDTLARFDPLVDKFPAGVISCGKRVEFRLEANLDCMANEVYLMLKEDSEDDYKYIAMQKEGSHFFVCVEFEYAGHFWYNFKLNYNDFAKYLSKTNDCYSIVLDEKGEDFLQLVTMEEYASTNSMQGGIIYQILVDRFCRVGNPKPREPLCLREDWGGRIKKNTEDPIKINEEVFGGNFEGVISKLDYLQDLGVKTIYFNPICMANSHHKYDTADYMTVDPMYGTEETFKKLIDEAKKRDIKIIIDGVYNHTGSDSIYFNKLNRFDSVGAYNSRDSKYYEWYEFDEYPNKYASWWGIDTLPSIKDNCESFIKYIAGEGGVIEKYMKLGVFGVRLDVIDEINDEFTKQISNRVKSFSKDAPIVGEVWEDASTKISYSRRRKYFAHNELNSVMNYPVKETILNYIRTKNPYDLNSTLRMLQNNYPKVVMDNLMNFLGTHDTGRIYSELKGIAKDNLLLTKKFLKIATGILFTLPGVPTIFYGDEYGMENNDGSSRGCFNWSEVGNDISEWYKKLTSIRKLEVFKDGKLNIIVSKNGKFIFERVSKSERILVLTSLLEPDMDIALDGDFTSLLTGNKTNKFVLKENEIEILYEKK